MKFSFFFLCMVIGVHSIAQTTIVISGIATDKLSHQPLEGCYIQIEGTACATNSLKTGEYEIRCSLDVDSIRLTCSLPNYASASVVQRIAVNSQFKFKLIVDFELEFESYLLPEINVSSTPEVVWSSDELNVADFAFIDRNILLLTYKQEERWKKQEESKLTLLQDCALIFVDSNHKEMMRASVPEIAIDFYVDYLNEVFLRCRHSIFHVRIDESKITLEKIADESFKRSIKPVIDTLGKMTCFSNYNEEYPAFEYMLFNAEDSSHKTFRCMIDENMMEMFRSEYKYLDPRGKLEAFRFEVNTGIDKEIIAAYMNGFQNTHYYEPLNTPLVTCNDTLIIFDHHHDKMIHFDWNGQKLDSALISYHKSARPERWDEKILKDHLTQKIYTTFRKSGITYLREINKKSGAVTTGQKLTYKYVEHIRISNGYMYYVYRPFESAQNRFLYKEFIQRDKL
jgi:hypothetical protein